MESFEILNAIRPDRFAIIYLDVRPGRLALMLILLVGFLLPAFAQSSAPKWIQQLKLSGVSIRLNQRLAIINNQTFAIGEDNVLKVAGKKVLVKCLEIRDQSVLILVNGLPDPCELTLSGEVIYRGTGPATPVSQPPVVQIQTRTPFPTPLTGVSSRMPTGSVFSFSSPIAGDSSFSALRWIGLVVLSLLVIVIVARALDRDGGHISCLTPLQVPQQKNLGEAMVANVIHSEFNRPHRLLNDLTLPTDDGTTQIDHVLITDTGIFVIESKHYSGWIFGNPKESKWTQMMINRQKFRFQNPLRQNYGHVKTLQSLLDLPTAYFHTVVVFTGDAEFKTDLGPNVVHLSGLVSLLSVSRPMLLEEARRNFVNDRIERARLPCSDAIDKLHIENVRRKVAAKRQSMKTRASCPMRAATTQSININASVSPDARYMPKA